VHTSRVDPRIGEILLPGEPEYRTGRQRQKEGIPIDDTTWARIGEAARGLGLDPDSWPQG
jgi:LDH2 family malate/lactate/ureidoglycolate dehydrogenase